MIQNIYGSDGIIVGGSINAAIPYIPGDSYSAGPGIPGELRVIGNCIHIWANGIWNPFSGGMATIQLTPEIKSILDWGRHAMIRDQEIEKMAEKYPAVKTAKEQLDIVMALVKEHS